MTLARFVEILGNIAFYFAGLKEAIRSDGQGWLICACVLLITVVRSGITYSFGVFVVQLESTWHASMAEQNWIGTLSFCISLSFAPLSVAFIRMMKYRGYRIGGLMGTLILSLSCLCSSFVGSLEWMFFTHSLLYGVGSSLIYMASSLVIGEYFDKDHKYHVLATSILLCGYPIGSLLFNPINAALVDNFGWRVAFRVASGLILVTGIPTCWTFRSKDSPNMTRLEEEPEDNEIHVVECVEEELNKLKQQKCCTWQEVRARPEMVLWYLGNCLSYLGFFMPFLNLAYYMKLKGYPPTQSSWAITLLSFAECITYIIASFLGDYLKGKLVYVNIIASAALSAICILWPELDVNYGVICLIAIVMGGFLGLTIVYTYAASGEVTQQPIDVAWSFTNLWSGLGILMGPFFSGAIYDIRKCYDDVFYVVGALFFVDTVIFGSIPLLERHRAAHGGRMFYEEIDGTVGQQNTTETFRISQRSMSKSSLKDQEVEPRSEYGATTITDHASTLPEDFTTHKGSATNPFAENFGNGNVTNGQPIGYHQGLNPQQRGGGENREGYGGYRGQGAGYGYSYGQE